MTPTIQADKHVLIVEDDQAIRDFFALILETAGYMVTKAIDGRQAINYLRTYVRPDLILLDLKMPIMNGWEFRSLQKRDTLLASIPVIVCSSAGDIQEEAKLIGAGDYLEKPIAPEELLEKVKHYFG